VDVIKSILGFLKSVAMKLVHLGRVWAKLLEMLEEESIGIQMMGNWNPLMQSSCYSLKLPMQPIHKLVGFTDANSMDLNPRRVVVEVEESLLPLTPASWLLVISCTFGGG
jgi:hypothetical protein